MSTTGYGIGAACFCFGIAREKRWLWVVEAEILEDCPDIEYALSLDRRDSRPKGRLVRDKFRRKEGLLDEDFESGIAGSTTWE